MHRGNDVNQALRRQMSGGVGDSQAAQSSPAETVMSLTPGTDMASLQQQQQASQSQQQQQASPAVAQLQQNPLQHYIMTGQVQNISVATPATGQQTTQHRPQILGEPLLPTYDAKPGIALTP